VAVTRRAARKRYKHYLKKCWPEKKKVKTMLPKAISKSKRVSHSLTDRILTLCISGRFGLREAIAEAIRHKGETNKTPAQRHGFRERAR
jgi:hypothetical protein